MDKKLADHLNKVVDSIVNEDQDTAKDAFHKYLQLKARTILEANGCCLKTAPNSGEADDPKKAQGEKAVKDTVKKTADEEIKATGEEADDPKKAQGEKSVKDTVKKTADEEIKATGDEADDPKKAQGEKAVKDTVKKTADEEIKA